MWPLAVAKLGLRYLRSNYSERFGHPSSNPLWTAFRSIKNFGVAQRLVDKFDVVGRSSPRVLEAGQGDSWVDVAGINWEVWGTT
jgi:hypothetical protein